MTLTKMTLVVWTNDRRLEEIVGALDTWYLNCRDDEEPPFPELERVEEVDFRTAPRGVVYSWLEDHMPDNTPSAELAEATAKYLAGRGNKLIPRRIRKHTVILLWRDEQEANIDFIRGRDFVIEKFSLELV